MSTQTSEKHPLTKITKPSTAEFYLLLHKLQHTTLSPNDMFVTLQKLQMEIDNQNSIAWEWYKQAHILEGELK